MKIPKKIKIGGHIIDVTLDKKYPDEKLHGETDYNKNTIMLNANLAPSQIVATFYHEFLHVVNTELEHEKVEYLAQALAQLHIDNNLNFYVPKKSSISKKMGRSK